MHPFDLRAALLAKHAQHVVLIHFPIALFVAGVAFDWAAQFSRKSGLTFVAYYNLVLAGISAVPAAVTGVLAWQWQLGGQRLHGVLLLHLLLGLSATAILVSIGWIHFRAMRAGDALPKYRLALEAVGVVIVALTGHLGGFLSGVNVPG